jgi:hypothetical protein
MQLRPLRYKSGPTVRIIEKIDERWLAEEKTRAA